MKTNKWTRLKHAVWCMIGKHVWQRPVFIRLNILPGEEDFECYFCGKHKTFFNRKETILFMPNTGDKTRWSVASKAGSLKVRK